MFTSNPLAPMSALARYFLPLALTLCAVSPAIADAGCDTKRDHLQQQLEQAREHDQPQREAGLQRALNAVKDHCTTDSLIGDSREALADLENERRDQQEELEEARQDKDASDIAKHQRKLDELGAEIDTQRQHLKALESLPE